MKNAIIAAIVATIISAPTSVFAADMARGFFGGVDVQSTDTTRTTLGVRGTEAAVGTAKISHEPSAEGATDPNASVLSLRAESVGTNGNGPTAAQGIFFDAPGGTTGKLLNLRIRGQEVFVLKAAPTASNPNRVILTINGPIVSGS